MPLIIGDKTIKDIYVGEKKIVKSYLGDNGVFGMKKLSRLPDGYTEVEYIETPNTDTADRIVTDVTIDVSEDVLHIDFCNTINNYFGARVLFSWLIIGNYAYDRAYLTLQSESSVRGTLDWKNFFEADVDVYQNRLIYEVNFKSQKISVGDKVIDISNFGIPRTVLYLFGSSYYGDRMALGRLYYAKVENDAGLKAEFVPCLNPENKAGVYETVSEKFLNMNAGTNLTAGPAV